MHVGKERVIGPGVRLERPVLLLQQFRAPSFSRPPSINSGTDEGCTQSPGQTGTRLPALLLPGEEASQISLGSA